MSVGTFLKTTKGKVITIGGGTVVAIGIAAAVLLQGSGYRSIAVEQVSGSVNVVGEKNNGQAYEGQHLYSGDDVTVGDASELTMCMDNDKYVYADANTHFKLEASDASEDSMIKIYLDAGSELNELQSKLAEGESYEVDTPNSTMSVRGTSFRVTVYKDKDGLIYTLVEVESGQVLVRLKTTDGSYNGIEKLFMPGESALIRGNSDFSEFVTSELLDAMNIKGGDEEGALQLAYDNLPEDGLERLIALLENMDENKDKKPVEKITKKEKTETDKKKKTTEEVEETVERETVDNRSFYTIIVEPHIANRNEDGTISLKDGVLFDPEYYARTYPDVVKNFGSDDDALLAHWLIFGQNENRFPNEAAEKERLALWLAFEEEQKVVPESDSSSGGSKVVGTTATWDLNTNYLYIPGHNASVARSSSLNGRPSIAFDSATQTNVNLTLPLTVPANSSNPFSQSQYTVDTVKDIDWAASNGNGFDVIVSDRNSNVASILHDANGNAYYTLTGPNGNWDSRNNYNQQITPNLTVEQAFADAIAALP
jgi:hypothetical protein